MVKKRFQKGELDFRSLRFLTSNCLKEFCQIIYFGPIFFFFFRHDIKLTVVSYLTHILINLSQLINLARWLHLDQYLGPMSCNVEPSCHKSIL